MGDSEPAGTPTHYFRVSAELYDLMKSGRKDNFSPLLSDPNGDLTDIKIGSRLIFTCRGKELRKMDPEVRENYAGGFEKIVARIMDLPGDTPMRVFYFKPDSTKSS